MKLVNLVNTVAPDATLQQQKINVQRMRRVVKILANILKREPVATDLNRVTLDALGDALQFFPTTVLSKRKEIAAFRRLWRIAIARKLVPPDVAAGSRLGRPPMESLGDASLAGKPLGPGVKLLRLIAAYVCVPHFPHSKKPGRYTRAKLKKLFDHDSNPSDQGEPCKRYK